MCWNKDVSLNTFIFSSFVLGLIIYNNTYTQYKIDELNSIWVYLFLMSFILIQLIEYFIWLNIKNPLYNGVFTMLATLLLLVQPIVSTMLITNKIVQQKMLYSYILFIIPVALYKFNVKKINSSVSELGHLRWNTVVSYDTILDKLFSLIWGFFFLFPLFYQGYNFGLLFGSLTLIILIYNFYKDKSIGSMWCWIVNAGMLYYAGYLLFYLPFLEQI